MPPKLLDIRVEVPDALPESADVAGIRVLDAGEDNPEERVSHVHYYATAMAVLLELHFQRLMKKSTSTASSTAAQAGCS